MNDFHFNKRVDIHFIDRHFHSGMKVFLQQCRRVVGRKNRAHFCVEIQEPPYFDPDADTMATPFLMCPNNMQPDIFCRCLAENIYAPLSDFLEMSELETDARCSVA